MVLCCKDNSKEADDVLGVGNKDTVETENHLSEKPQESCTSVHNLGPLNAKKNKVVLDRFIETIVSSALQKQKYENKSLLLCNRTNMAISKIMRNAYYFNDFSIDYIIDSLDEFFTMFSSAYDCMDESFSGNINKALHRFATIKIKFKILVEILEEFESYRSETKSMLMYNNLHELKKISMDIQNSLNLIGVTIVYKPPPSLSLSSCVENISELTGSNEEKFVKSAMKGINKLQTSPLKRINDY